MMDGITGYSPLKKNKMNGAFDDFIFILFLVGSCQRSDIQHVLGNTLKRFVSTGIKILPGLCIPNFNAIGYADDNGVSLDTGIIFQVRRNDEPALSVRYDLNRPGEKQTVETPRFLFRKGKILEFLLLGTPFLFAEHEDAFVQSPGQEKFIDAVFLAHVPEAGRDDDASFPVNGMTIFAIKHICSVLGKLNQKPLMIEKRRP
jgi:hypothetical protein